MNNVLYYLVICGTVLKRAQIHLQAETEPNKLFFFKTSSFILNMNNTSLDPTWNPTHNTGLSEEFVEHLVESSLCETPH